jgi:hypothetical protein
MRHAGETRVGGRSAHAVGSPRLTQLQAMADRGRGARMATLQRLADETFAPAQRLEEEEELQMMAADEEEPLQGQMEDEEPLQGQLDEDELLQGRFGDDEEPLQGRIDPTAPAQLKEDEAGGLPADLRAGVEDLSGVSLDGVRVHRNSGRPAQIGALAYAQGSEIHLGPGQERHLPHEAWHIAQQAQGRVQPTAQAAGGVSINADPSLESEADRMGAVAAQRGAEAVQAVEDHDDDGASFEPEPDPQADSESATDSDTAAHAHGGGDADHDRDDEADSAPPQRMALSRSASDGR